MSYEIQQEIGALLGAISADNLTRAEELAAQATQSMWWPWFTTPQRAALGAFLNTADDALVARLIALCVKLSHGNIDLHDMELERVPAALEAHAGQLRAINLSGNRIKVLPAWLLGLTGLETLELSNNLQLKDWPQPTPASSSLKTLRLQNAAFAALPDDVSALGALTELDISGIGLAALPDAIGQLTHLETLLAERNKLAQLPDALGELKALKILNLKSNKLTKLPDALAGLEALTHLNVYGNKLTGFPMVILTMSLKDADGIPGYMKKPKKPALQAFLRKLKMISIPRDMRERIFEMFEDDTCAQTFSLTRHLEAQQVDYEPLRKRAMSAIFADLDHLYSANPLKEGAVVAALGKLTLKKTEIKDKCAKAKLVYSPALTDKVTHVVIEPGARDFDLLTTHPCTFLTEQQLIDHLDSFEEHFLLDKDESTQQSVEHIAEMLMSVDEASQALGLELLKTGGVPATLMTELFIISTFAEDKKLKEAAKKLVKLHGTKGAQDAIKDRTKILSTAYDKVEKLTAESIWHYHRNYGRDIDFVRVALWMMRRFARGGRFILDHQKPGSDARKEAVALMIKDGTFDLYSGYATYRPDYLNPYSYYDKLRFPVEVLDHPEITTFDAHGCNLSELPEDISRLKHLKHMNLDYNMLQDLPAGLAELTSLETLSLQCNEFKALPLVLSKMTWLKELDLRKNRQDKQLHPITLTDAERSALSRCKVLTD